LTRTQDVHSHDRLYHSHNQQAAYTPLGDGRRRQNSTKSHVQQVTPEVAIENLRTAGLVQGREGGSASDAPEFQYQRGGAAHGGEMAAPNNSGSKTQRKGTVRVRPVTAPRVYLTGIG